MVDREFSRDGRICNDVWEFLVWIVVGKGVEEGRRWVMMEVEMNMRERDRVGIEERVEEEMVVNGVDVGNREGVR